MIPQDFISEWKKHAPWLRDYQVEQDLIICRVLIEIFSHPHLAENLAFRGGTALYKLHLSPVRYSEDIDLVQVHPGPIGPVMDALQEKINSWLGRPGRKQSEGRITLTYRIQSEEGLPLKLKVEINSREHFSVLGFDRVLFVVDSRYFTGSAYILTYKLEDLLGTKIRALYPRKKGRDLFDLWMAFSSTDAQPEKVLNCFLHYMEHEGHKVSRAEFEQNLVQKLDDSRFLKDIEPLQTTDINWNSSKAGEYLMNRLLALLPGEPWQGGKS